MNSERAMAWNVRSLPALGLALSGALGTILACKELPDWGGLGSGARWKWTTRMLGTVVGEPAGAGGVQAACAGGGELRKDPKQREREARENR